MQTLVGIFLFLAAIVGVVQFFVWLGKRNAKKAMTLEDLDFRVRNAMLNELNAKSLKATINEMRRYIENDLNTSEPGTTEYVAATCAMKRLESIEITFQFRFVEFGGSFKNPKPEVSITAGTSDFNKKIEETKQSVCDLCGHRNEEICNTCTLVNQPDSCCGIYEENAIVELKSK